MPNRNVYTWRPGFLYERTHPAANSTIRSRNQYTVELLADVHGWTYVGELKGDISGLGPDDVLVPHVPIDEAFFDRLDRRPEVIGAVTPSPLLVQKTAARMPLSEAGFIPADFPFDFADRVSSFSVPGYSCFDKADVDLAVERLIAGGYTPRLKRARSSGGRGQLVPETRAQVVAFLEDISEAEMRSTGVVVEANIDVDRELCVGWMDVEGERFSYVGVQRPPSRKNPHVGVKIAVRRGALSTWLDDPRVAHVSEVGGRIGEAIHEALALDVSRVAINLIEGTLVGGHDVRDDIFFTEHTVRIGVATGAEALAQRSLLEGATVAHAEAGAVDCMEPPTGSVALSGYRDMLQFYARPLLPSVRVAA